MRFLGVSGLSVALDVHFMGLITAGRGVELQRTPKSLALCLSYYYCPILSRIVGGCRISCGFGVFAGAERRVRRRARSGGEVLGLRAVGAQLEHLHDGLQVNRWQGRRGTKGAFVVRLSLSFGLGTL